jgi:hypothetical protein
LGQAPRKPEAIPVISNPAMRVRAGPHRAISRDPGSAAAENRITGIPASTPTSVADKPKSALIIGMTGGIARMVKRRALPLSHRSTMATKKGGILKKLSRGQADQARPLA